LSLEKLVDGMEGVWIFGVTLRHLTQRAYKVVERRSLTICGCVWVCCIHGHLQKTDDFRNFSSRITAKVIPA
jgi:hypothetical protein